MIKKIVKLSSASCSPCKQYEPIFNSFKSELESLGWAIEILDVTEDRGGAYAQKYGVRGVPNIAKNMRLGCGRRGTGQMETP